MFDDRTNLTQALQNPMSIAALALDELQNRLSGNKIIADPNTPFCHLLEFGSSVAASVMNAVEDKLPLIYPKRAKTMEDLYTHMSDFDYLRMYSSPSYSTIRLHFVKQHLINHAVKYNANYSKLVIPSNTRFIVGKRNFGIYYPINILINNYTKSFTVTYDTTHVNPLHTLSKNVVDKYDLNYRGLEYLVLDFPIYQFSKSTVEESLVSATGFAKKLEYNDNFYALRIFHYKNGAYHELSQTQSKLVYDTSNPTALIQVLPDESKVKIVVPQIYFDEGLMGSKLLVEIYTTEGKLDIDTSNITGEGIGVTYDTGIFEDKQYSLPFKNLPYDNIISLSGTRITGGSNAIGVNSLRNRVISDTLYDKVPISEAELTQLLNDEGFYVAKYRDNITDRRYYAYRVIRDTNNTIIPSLSGMLSFYTSHINDGNHSSILYFSADNSVTLLPTALYKYQYDVNSVTILPDDEVDDLINNGKGHIVEELNNNQYLRSLYHLRIDLNYTYPRADTYDLQTPRVNRILFEEDNSEVAAKMMAFNATINHDNIGKYEVYLSINRSDDLRYAAPSAVKIYIATRDENGNWIGTEGELVSVNNTTMMDTWKFEIPTTYHLTLDNKISCGLTNPDVPTLNVERLIPLTAEFHLVCFASAQAVGISGESTDSLVAGVPESVKLGYIGLSRQLLHITLGRNLNDVIHNNTEAAFSKTTYQRYPTDIVARYSEDEYERDRDGYLKYTTDADGNMSLIKLHSMGDIIKDDKGRIVYEHRAGDIIRGSDGLPVAAEPGEVLYYIDMIFIDAKVFFSDRQAELTFQSNIYTAMSGYLETIRGIQDQLLERTNIYFNCVRSTGYGKINRGDGQIYNENIELSFRIVCYVPSYVKQSETIQNEITDMTCRAIEDAIDSKTISMLDIFESVKTKMSDYIDHFDLLGINNDVTLQTFTTVDEDCQPSICRKLVLSEDNILTLKKQIDITYIALTDNTAEATSYEE